MGTEIERKYLVSPDWRSDRHSPYASQHIVQGYLDTVSGTARIRLTPDEAIFTVKGKTIGISRSEWEWDIPFEDAEAILDELCGERVIRKTRHKFEYAGKIWEVDEFHGPLKGLTLGEVELESEDEEFEVPDWALKDVSDDPRYFNQSLAIDGTV